ncbi:MAG TPA: chitin deacetylase family protein [Gemmatimonadaceae bacterium]|nr:chitin deacetylase family protein [Gemmatimonadaceae bacterium]
MVIRITLPFLIALAASSCLPDALVRGIAAGNPGCLYRVPRADRIVALTLDDGPDSTTTPELLKILADNNARATFFLISGNVPGNDTLVQRLVREGHEIGNHFSENEASIALSPRAFERSFLTADSVLRRFAPVRWVRPGSGHYNKRMVTTFRKHGYQCALGSVYPFDPQIRVPAFSAWVIRRNVRPGAVIILNDGSYKGRNTSKTLRRVLPDLTERGYRVVTLSELAGKRAGTR